MVYYKSYWILFFTHNRDQPLESFGTRKNIPLRLMPINFNMRTVTKFLHQLEISMFNQILILLAPIQVHLMYKMHLLISKLWEKGLQHASRLLFVDFWYCYMYSFIQNLGSLFWLSFYCSFLVYSFVTVL